MALPKARWGHRMEVTGKGKVTDLMVFDGLYEIFYGYHMGITAENIAAKYDISRQEQDELSVLSHQRARDAIENNIFKDEIVPITITGARQVVTGMHQMQRTGQKKGLFSMCIGGGMGMAMIAERC